MSIDLMKHTENQIKKFYITGNSFWLQYTKQETHNLAKTRFDTLAYGTEYNEVHLLNSNSWTHIVINFPNWIERKKFMKDVFKVLSRKGEEPTIFLNFVLQLLTDGVEFKEGLMKG